MSKDIKSKVERKKKDTKISSADDLTKTSKRGDIELDEEELKRVSGGAGTQDAVKST
jgi:bacteriocin-like protein